MSGRLDLMEHEIKLGGIVDFSRQLVHARRIIITACGTAWHAGLVGEYLLEEFAEIPTEVDYASEFRYRNPLIEEGTVQMVISQSGSSFLSEGCAPRRTGRY